MNEGAHPNILPEDPGAGGPYSRAGDLQQQRHRALTPERTDHVLLEQARDQLAQRFDTVAEFLPHYTPDATPADDQTTSQFPRLAMARAYLVKLVSPEIDSFGLLEHRLRANPEWAQALGFDSQRVPDRTTFSKQWWTRYSEAYRSHLRWEAANAARQAQQYNLDISDEARELIEQYDPTTTTADIPDEHRLELAERDRVFNEFRNLFAGLFSYGRGPNKQIASEELTELATFTARRRESVRGGRDVYVHENAVSDRDYMTEEALAKPIRALSRQLAETRYATEEPLPPDERRYDWSVNPEDRDFEQGQSWHKRTEAGVGEQVRMLQERGMLDRPVDICIDGTARDYHNRNDTDVDEPAGVLHRYPKYDTGYAYEDITVTAIYRGRALVLANISKVKADSRFQCVRYLIDRARSLVNVRNVYADSEFGTQRICSYITHCGLDYVIKKRKTPTVKRFFEEAEGRADFTDYEIEGKDHTRHKTTLLALEKISKNVTKKGEKRKANESGDGLTQATLPGLDADDEDENDDEEEFEYASFVTSIEVEARGLEPNAAGPRQQAPTAFGVGQLYRKRWSIETAFRDVKQNFKARPRSRCLGVRRFFFALCLLLYNCWVLLNLIVANEMEHRDDDEIVWRKKIFVIDMEREVFSDREFG